jgi:hypothetical protein
MRIKNTLCTFFAILCSQSGFSQSAIKGRVVDENTRRPLVAVSVYLNNTTIGAMTDEKGFFTIEHVPSGKFRLVASSIGYETFVRLINPGELSGELLITLKPKTEQLKGVEVKPFDPDCWEKWGKIFTGIFIGTNPNSYECQLENFLVIKFRQNDDNSISVFATEPIRIRNNALGYEISYRLEEFEYDFTSKVVTYGGYAFFKDLAPDHPKKSLKWIEQRNEVYQISLMRFMRVFFLNKLQQEGYEIRSLKKIINQEKLRAKKMFSTRKDSMIVTVVDTVNDFKKGAIITTVHSADSTEYYKKILLQPDSVISHHYISADSIGFAADSSTAGLYFPDSLEISYPPKGIPNEYKRISKNHKEESFPVSQFVFIAKKPVFVLSNGYYYGPYDLKITGFWAWWETISNLLPYDYVPMK